MSIPKKPLIDLVDCNTSSVINYDSSPFNNHLPYFSFIQLALAMFSFHSHSGQFCMHAKGTLEQVVQSAIDRRFTTYGLSEHMPRYNPDQLYPEEVPPFVFSTFEYSVYLGQLNIQKMRTDKI